MSTRAWVDFLAILVLSALVAAIGQPRGPCLILAAIGAATAIVGAIQDHASGR